MQQQRACIIIALSIIAILTASNICLLIVFCIRSLKFFNGCSSFAQNKLSLLSLLTISTSVIYLIAEWNTVFTLIYNPSQYNLAYHIMFGIIGIHLGIFYLLLIFRVHVAFKDRIEYKLTNCEIKSLICFLLTLILEMLFIDVGGSMIFTDWFSWPYLVSIAIFIFTDILFNVVVLYMFLHRLYRMILNLDESLQQLLLQMQRTSLMNANKNYDDMHDEESKAAMIHVQLQDKVAGNRKYQMEIVDMMTKISLLTMISQVLFHIWDIMFIVTHAMGFGSNCPLLLIIAVIRGIGMFFNAFASHSVLVYNNNHYVKCCEIPHGLLNKCCVLYVVKKTTRI